MRFLARHKLPGPGFHRQATTSLRTRRSTTALRHGVTSRSAGAHETGKAQCDLAFCHDLVLARPVRCPRRAAPVRLPGHPRRRRPRPRPRPYQHPRQPGPRRTRRSAVPARQRSLPVRAHVTTLDGRPLSEAAALVVISQASDSSRPRDLRRARTDRPFHHPRTYVMILKRPWVSRGHTGLRWRSSRKHRAELASVVNTGRNGGGQQPSRRREGEVLQ
jgi:hypothetical protein